MLANPDSKQKHPQMSQPKHHPRFYFDDGNVIFQVENTLFNVHRYFFKRDSPIFSAMFSLPQPSPPPFPPPPHQQEPLDKNGKPVEPGHRGTVKPRVPPEHHSNMNMTTNNSPSSESSKLQEGSSDDNPIILTGSKAEDFACLLEVMYPKDFGSFGYITQHKWTSVLDISTRFDFAAIRSLAIIRLDMLMSKDPIDSIVLGRWYDVPQWLESSYQYLCVRQESLSMEEGVKLGLQDVIGIADVRQSIRYAANLNRHPDSIAELVRQTFLGEKKT